MDGLGVGRSRNEVAFVQDNRLLLLFLREEEGNGPDGLEVQSSMLQQDGDGQARLYRPRTSRHARVDRDNNNELQSSQWLQIHARVWLRPH